MIAPCTLRRLRWSKVDLVFIFNEASYSKI